MLTSSRSSPSAESGADTAQLSSYINQEGHAGLPRHLGNEDDKGLVFVSFVMARNRDALSTE